MATVILLAPIHVPARYMSLAEILPTTALAHIPVLVVSFRLKYPKHLFMTRSTHLLTQVVIANGRRLFKHLLHDTPISHHQRQKLINLPITNINDDPPRLQAQFLLRLLKAMMVGGNKLSPEYLLWTFYSFSTLIWHTVSYIIYATHSLGFWSITFLQLFSFLSVVFYLVE